MAAPTQIKSYPTPLIADVLFYEILDFSKSKYADITYGDQHYDRQQWPHHRVVDISVHPSAGENSYVVHYAADRDNQDLYNFEHSKADLSGFKFDTITRSYVIPRKDYDPVTPALGVSMANVPKDKFINYADFVLIARNQDRISERGRRAQESIGSGELDSLYVVETRTYIDKTELVASDFSDEVNGVLYERANIYTRGEVYDTTSGDTIEIAVTKSSHWSPTAGGQISSYSQASDDVWVVTTRDIIPQEVTQPDAPLFGGRVMRVFPTTMNYTWPAVLEDMETLVWPLKNGEERQYNRPVFKRQGYRGPCPAEIHDEWVTETQLKVATLDVVETLAAMPVYYICPFFTVNIPPTLHRLGVISANIGTNDPVYGWTIETERCFAATQVTTPTTSEDAVDWPESLIVDVKPTPYEGGYIIRRIKCFRPYSETQSNACPAPEPVE